MSEVDYGVERQNYDIDGIKITPEELSICEKYGVRPKLQGAAVVWQNEKGALHSYDDVPSWRSLDGKQRCWTNNGLVSRITGPANIRPQFGYNHYWFNDKNFLDNKDAWEKAVKEFYQKALDNFSPIALLKKEAAVDNKVINGVVVNDAEYEMAARTGAVPSKLFDRIIWKNKAGLIHSFEDLPAERNEIGSTVKSSFAWYKDGHLHRANGPAWISDEIEEYHLNGYCLSKADYDWANNNGLDLITLNNRMTWVKKGTTTAHAPDKPVYYDDGSYHWKQDGKYHRIGGPAIGAAFGGGADRYFISSIELDKETYDKYINQLNSGEIILHQLDDAFYCTDNNGRLHADGVAAYRGKNYEEFRQHGDLHNESGAAVKDTANNNSYYLNGISYSKEDWEKKVAPLSPKPLPVFTVAPTTFDFGAGPVPAHQHSYGKGWVADTAIVEEKVYVGPKARVFDRAIVRGRAKITGTSRVCGTSLVYDRARVYSSIVQGRATVQNQASVRNSQIDGDAAILESAFISRSTIFDACIKGVSIIKNIFGNGPKALSVDADIFTQAEWNKVAAQANKPKEVPVKLADTIKLTFSVVNPVPPIAPAPLPVLEIAPNPFLIQKKASAIVEKVEPTIRPVSTKSLDERTEPSNKTVFGVMLAGALLGLAGGKRFASNKAQKTFVKPVAKVVQEEQAIQVR